MASGHFRKSFAPIRRLILPSGEGEETLQLEKLKPDDPPDL